MKLSLVVLTPGKSEGKTIPINLPQFLIGRDAQCQLRPASPLISKRHCVILVRNGKVYLRDFDSTNGSFVNDKPVKGQVELHHEDRLRIGPLNFGVRIEGGAPAAPPPPAQPKPAAESKPAEPPAPSEASKGEAVDDEDVAAWLLSTQDEGEGGASGEAVPEGSTVMMELPAGAVPPPADPAAPLQPGKPGEKKDKVGAVSDSADAARAILQKYMKRPRG
jgi:predicted component of type VI protein secretion system